jgi:hypothetical protein
MKMREALWEVAQLFQVEVKGNEGGQGRNNRTKLVVGT